MDRYLDLQMFADELDGVEDDDNPKEVDLDEEDDGEEPDDEDFSDDEFDQLAADDEPEEEKEEEAEEEAQPEDESPADGKTYTKAERDAAIEAAINERFLRDPYRQAMKDLEKMTGLPPERIVELHRKQQEDADAERYAEEHGLTDEEAREYIRKERENRELRDKLAGIERQTHYNTEKSKYLNNPHVRKYAAEMDAFSGNGEYCNFEAAMNYILGQKLLSGEISGAIESGTVKKTLADIEKQKRVKVQKGAVGGKRGGSERLDPFQKAIGGVLGVSAKEIAAEKAMIERERRGGK